MDENGRTSITVALLASMALCACSSAPKIVAPIPPQQFERLGTAKGGACGVHLFNIIPINYNSRVQRAYTQTMINVPSATGVINVKYEEDWYYIGIGTMRCVRMTGEAIK
jgi:hypothetical protein